MMIMPPRPVRSPPACRTPKVSSEATCVCSELVQGLCRAVVAGVPEADTCGSWDAVISLFGCMVRRGTELRQQRCTLSHTIHISRSRTWSPKNTGTQLKTIFK
jgi:hypothetical protein